MDSEVTLTLSRLFVGQVLDMLEDQRDIWEYTERFLIHGQVEEDRIIAEASSPEDARKMMDYYGDIITRIRCQLPA